MVYIIIIICFMYCIGITGIADMIPNFIMSVAGFECTFFVLSIISISMILIWITKLYIGN